MKKPCSNLLPEDFQNSGKMDLFAGSEPRKFISFHLDKEHNDQPSSSGYADNQDLHGPDAAQQNEQVPPTSTELEEELPEIQSPEIENVLQGNLVIDVGSNEPEPEMSTSAAVPIVDVQREEAVESQTAMETDSKLQLMEIDEIVVGNPVEPTSGQTNEASGADAFPESSSSQKSCQTYFTRRMEELGGEEYSLPVQEVTILVAKESSTEALPLNPGLNRPTFESFVTVAPPTVAYLDSDHNYVIDPRLRLGRVSPNKPKISVEPGRSLTPPDVPVEARHDLVNEEDEVFATESSVSNAETECRESHISGNDTSVRSDVTSFGAARSTLAEALLPPPGVPRDSFDISSGSEAEETTFGQNVEDSRVHRLCKTSRAIINHYFREAATVELPRGHATLVLNADQVQSILRVVADESARASYAMMEDIIERARRLNLSSDTTNRYGPADPFGRRVTPSSEVDGFSDRETDRAGSSTSGALRSDDDSNSIGYRYERTPPSLIAISRPPQRYDTSHMDPSSSEPHLQVASPGAQTLASLKEEALRDQQSKGRKPKIPRKPCTQRRRVTRSCKIMKEEYFEGMAWTRTFVSGPVDPKWNKYKFYCQICKGNVSIYGKGAREILRHYSTDKHLRKDQRWRYEHLSTIDPHTKAVQHQVRGKDGKILTPYQLEQELKYFIDAELVDIGEKLPFYHEFMAGAQHMTSSPDNRARVTISILGHYLPTFGDIRALRGLWKDIGVVVNHQALFKDFNWGKERLSVSILL